MDSQIKEQLFGTIVNEFKRLFRIAGERNKQIFAGQDEAFNSAATQINKVLESVGKPDNRLGSPLSKHGKIVEPVEVGIHNARHALEANGQTATVDGVNRTAAPENSIHNARQALEANGQTATIDGVGRTAAPENSIHNARHALEANGQTATIDGVGRTAHEDFGHEGSYYHQQDTVRKTLDRHEDELAKKNSENKIHQDHKPSFQEGLTATGVATAVGASIYLTTGLYKKHKEGKRFYKGDFTVKDWKEVGGDTLKGGVIGGVSGAAIYGLTSYAPLSAPFAGAVVSATKGVASLVKDYHSGKINNDEFFELGMVICAESAIVGIATAAGQTIIPIPVLGAVLGSVAGSMFVKIISKSDRKTATKIRREIEGYIQKLDAVTQALIKRITAKFEKLGELTKAAFSFENNEKLLQYSIDLARAYGVDENKIIKSHDELDNFILI